jgi:acyl-CoA thioesterase I
MMRCVRLKHFGRNFVRFFAMIGFFLLSTSVIFPSFADAQPDKALMSLSRAPAILVWGDSLCAGYGIQPQEAWPSLLHKKLAAQDFSHRVVNGCISGETSAGGLSRLPLALKEHAPSILILSLGANDGLRGLPLSQMRDHLSQMIAQAEAACARVLLVGMKLPPNYGPAYTRGFARSFETVAKEHTTVTFLPFLLDGFAEDRSAFQDDGLHPTAAAQSRILATVWPVLEPMLFAPPPPSCR